MPDPLGAPVHLPGPARPLAPPPSLCFCAGHCPVEGESILGQALLAGRRDQTAEEENVTNSLGGLRGGRGSLRVPSQPWPSVSPSAW